MASTSNPALFEGRTLSAKLLRTHPRFYVGVDVGQAQDHSAIAVVERAEVLNPVRDPLTWSFHFDSRFHVRHAERIALGSPYPEVVAHVKELSRRYPLEPKNVTIIVDATGVGAPVVDLLRRGGLGCRVMPVVITGGRDGVVGWSAIPGAKGRSDGGSAGGAAEAAAGVRAGRAGAAGAGGRAAVDAGEGVRERVRADERARA